MIATPPPPSSRERMIYVAFCLVIVAASLVLYFSNAHKAEQRDAAQEKAGTATERAETAEQYIARLAKDCERDDDLGKELRASGRCPQAKQITQESETNPLPAAEDGRDGRGISGVGINAGGDLIVSFTDGTSLNVGRVRARDGRDAPPAKDGEPGEPGQDGRGITGTAISPDGNLIVSYSDGSSLNVGRVRGRDGINGTNGLNGKDGRTQEWSCVIRRDQTDPTVSRYYVAWKYIDEGAGAWRDFKRVRSEDRTLYVGGCKDLR